MSLWKNDSKEIFFYLKLLLLIKIGNDAKNGWYYSHYTLWTTMGLWAAQEMG